MKCDVKAVPNVGMDGAALELLSRLFSCGALCARAFLGMSCAKVTLPSGPNTPDRAVPG